MTWHGRPMEQPPQRPAVEQRPTAIPGVESGARDIVEAIASRFGASDRSWGDGKEFDAEPRYICPVCHSPREEHGCSTNTAFSVEDDAWLPSGERGRRSLVTLRIVCRHPDTWETVAAARRYHEIEPPEDP